MKRSYSETYLESSPNFFYGVEIEHTPAINMKTLFVVGVQPISEISARSKSVKHIYLGANQSFAPSVDWDTFIHEVLVYAREHRLFVTLDFDVSHIEWVLEGGYVEFSNFIPQISVKLPNINQLGYNATLKIDDIDFEKTNPGVWCHRVHDLMDTSKFTKWDDYKDDTLHSCL